LSKSCRTSIAVGVGLLLDWFIYITMTFFGFSGGGSILFFGTLVAAWYVLNELISIVENLDKMGAKVPKWLKSAMLLLRKKVNTKAASFAGGSSTSQDPQADDRKTDNETKETKEGQKDE